MYVDAVQLPLHERLLYPRDSSYTLPRAGRWDSCACLFDRCARVSPSPLCVCPLFGWKIVLSRTPPLALHPHQVYDPFISDFLRQVISEGLQAIVPNFTPRPEVLFGEGTTHKHLCDEVIRESGLRFIFLGLVYLSRLHSFPSAPAPQEQW